MLSYKTYCGYFVLLFINWIHVAQSMKLLYNKIPLLNTEPENEISEFIITKGHMPSDKDLPKTPLFKTVDNDITYLLSKLSDGELVRLLNEQPHKSQYNLKDIVKIANYSTDIQNTEIFDKDVIQLKTRNQKLSNAIKPKIENPDSSGPVYRLENKEVNVPQNSPHYDALQKLNSLLNTQITNTKNSENKNEEETRKELLFDALVAQLKTLCCKANNNNNDIYFKGKPLLHGIMPETDGRSKSASPIEHMFLIFNEEIKSHGRDDDLIFVDPDSLGNNSSVMLLGPVATPLADPQLKIVMKRISLEILKPEYQQLLKQISDGTLSSENMKLASSLISGPQTRRYVKPHRCNHQSKLARVYGGTKWIICTGYLNINTPSLYD